MSMSSWKGLLLKIVSVTSHGIHWNDMGNDCWLFGCPDPGAESHVNELSSPQQPSNPDAHASEIHGARYRVPMGFSSLPNNAKWASIFFASIHGGPISFSANLKQIATSH